MIFLYVCKRDWRHPGPIVNFVTHNAHSVAEAGVETHLVLGRGAESDPAADLREFYGLAPVETLHLHRVERRRLIGGSTSSLPIFFFAWRLARELARRDRVAIVTREAAFLPYLALLRRHRGISGYYEAHDLYADLSWRPKKPRVQDRRQQLIERLALPRLDGLVCITQAQRELYARIFPKTPVRTLALGVRPLSPAVDAEKRRSLRTVVYIGHLSPKKGLRLILEIAPRLVANRVRLALWGGAAPEIEVLRGRLRAAGVGDEWVKIVGFQAPRVVHKALAAEASVGLVVLTDTFYNRNLTCPAKALDYLAHGLPVVASDLPSTREVLGAAGNYAPAGDAAAVLREILRLLDDPAAYAHAAGAARARGEELAWRHRAERLVEFAEECSLRSTSRHLPGPGAGPLT